MPFEPIHAAEFAGPLIENLIDFFSATDQVDYLTSLSLKPFVEILSAPQGDTIPEATLSEGLSSSGASIRNLVVLSHTYGEFQQVVERKQRYFRGADIQCQIDVIEQ